MMGRIDERLAQLAIQLPTPAAPAGAYVPFVSATGLVFIAGQIPVWNGEVRFRGRLGEGMSLDDGKAAARLCALNLLAQVRAACEGDLDRVRRVIRLGGFVNCDASFTDQAQVLNGASELMVEVFGDAGRHARFAVGAPSLPLGVAVEVEGVFHIA
jgi:enamine deaminase RidA (YjgF/YER057c/UK114 family)